MSLVIGIARELFGLFVDDGALALAIIGAVALTSVLAAQLPQHSLAAGAFLLLSCLTLLVVSAARAAKSR